MTEVEVRRVSRGGVSFRTLPLPAVEAEVKALASHHATESVAVRVVGAKEWHRVA